MISLLIWGFQEFNQTKSNYLLIESMYRHNVERNSLRNQYFLYYNPYVLEQLNSEKAGFEALIQQAESQFTEIENRQLLRQLPRNNKKINTIFRRIVENHERMVVSDTEQRVIYEELEKRLISQFLLKISEVEQIFRSLLNDANNRIQQDYQKLVIITISFTTLLAITILVVMSQLSRMFSRRLVSLHEGAAIVANGELNYRINEHGHDEFSELAQSINFMTGNLQIFTQKLESEIQVRKETEEELIEAKLASEIANSAKSQFLSRMSHELRTPLNAIIGFAQLQHMGFTKDTPDRERESTNHIHEAGLHLLMLVEDIMDIVRIEQKQLEVPLEILQPSEAIKESISLVQLEADANQVELILEPSNLCIIANHHRLKQVLVNLLSNAIKYNTKGGTVTIQTDDVGPDEVELRITDTGVGINANDYEAIFEPFTRLKYAETHAVQGAGIGLALTKFLVEQMNGSIGVDSDSTTGTTFWVKFPKGEVTGAASLVSQKGRPTNKNKTIAHSILYIEDNPASRELIKVFLQDYPEITLFLANTAEEGINIAEVKTPSVIFIDINLPKMNGFSAIGILKLMPNLSNSRMYALSADALPAQVEKAMQLGFDDYLIKPIRLEQIVKIIEEQ